MPERAGCQGVYMLLLGERQGSSTSLPTHLSIWPELKLQELVSKPPLMAHIVSQIEAL